MPCIGAAMVNWGLASGSMTGMVTLGGCDELMQVSKFLEPIFD